MRGSQPGSGTGRYLKLHQCHCDGNPGKAAGDCGALKPYAAKSGVKAVGVPALVLYGKMDLVADLCNAACIFVTGRFDSRTGLPHRGETKRGGTIAGGGVEPICYGS